MTTKVFKYFVSKVFALVNMPEYVPTTIPVLLKRRTIPIDTRCDPILADLFLLLLEADFSG